MYPIQVQEHIMVLLPHFAGVIFRYAYIDWNTTKNFGYYCSSVFYE